MKILLDPGHGPTTNPYPDGVHYEGFQMYYLAYYLFQELKAKGRYTLQSTRNKVSEDPTTQERGEKARGADLFLSLHSNACDTPTVDRVVVIPTITNTDAPFRNFCLQLGDKVKDCLACDGKTQIFDRSYYDVLLKTEVDYYAVLRNAVNVGCKQALILEHSFHTNAEKASLLCQTEVLKLLAKKETEIIDRYLSPQTVNTPSYWGHDPADIVTYNGLWQILHDTGDE